MTTAETVIEGRPETRPTSLWRDTAASILRQRSAIFGLVILSALVLVAIFAPVIATHDPNQALLGVEQGVERRAGPCIHALGCPEDKPQHLFGTDGNFRDVFSRVVYGARTSLTIGFAAIGFAIVVGASIGAISGYLSGTSDSVIMRFMDVDPRVPVVAAGDRHRQRGRQEPRERAAGHRHRLHTGLCPHRPCVGPRDEGT